MSTEVVPGSDQAAEQSQPDSVIDRLESMLGNDPETPTEEAPADPENAQAEGDDAPAEAEPETPADSESVEVEFEGKTYKLPPELKDAVLRQADYTRKTQEVAEERKALMAERELAQATQAFQKEHAKDISEIQALDHQLAQYNAVNWAEAMQKDIAAATTAFMQRQQLIEARAALAANLSNAEQAFQQTQTQKAQELRAKGLEELSKRIPGFNAETGQKIRDSVKSYGFTDEELSQYRDPRVIHALHDAMKYRELIAQKPALTQKVTTLPKPVKPGSTAQAVTDKDIQIRKAQSALKTTGSSQAARELLMHRLK
jgi:hypothetical protein